MGNNLHKFRIWRASYAVFIANQDHVAFKSCDGKCLGLGTGRRKPTANTRNHSSPYYACKLHSLAWQIIQTKLPSTDPYWQKWMAGTGNCILGSKMFGRPLPKAVIELNWQNVGINQGVLAPDANAIVTNCHAHPSANVMLLSVQVWSGRKYNQWYRRVNRQSAFVVFCFAYILGKQVT